MADDHVHAHLDGGDTPYIFSWIREMDERYLTRRAVRLLGGTGWIAAYGLENCLKCDRAFLPRDGFIAFCYRCS